MTFAGVIVTYNRKEELEKNILAEKLQKKRFDRLYIIDNCSTDGTYDYLKGRGYLTDDIVYIRLKKNIGGAGGFYTGLRKAYEDGFDFICLMDDDGRPLENTTFESLYDAALNKYSENRKMILNSVVICESDTGELSFGLNNMISEQEIGRKSTDGFYPDYINPFNGTLVTKELVEAIGYPNKDFFVRGDEVDYLYRARNAGALIGTVEHSRYYHPSANLVPMKWRRRIVYVGICPPWKGYYLTRNYVYRLNRDNGMLSASKQFVFLLWATVRCNPDYRSCIRLLFKGYFDGIAGKLGRRVEPGTK